MVESIRLADKDIFKIVFTICWRLCRSVFRSSLDICKVILNIAGEKTHREYSKERAGRLGSPVWIGQFLESDSSVVMLKKEEARCRKYHWNRN